MALDDGNTTITTSASILGGVGKTLGDAVIAFNKVNVIAPLIASKTGITGSITVEWADWKVATYADVVQRNEFVEATVQQIDTTARTATLTEHVLQVDIADLAEQGYGAGGSLASSAGAVIGNAIAARLDNDLAALFAEGSFTNSVATAGQVMDVGDIFSALRLLHANQAPAPLNLVLGTQQVWGPKGLRLMIQGNATTPVAGSNVLGDAVGRDHTITGWVAKFAGFDVYTTPEIVEDSSNDEAGMAFSRNCFGMASPAKGLISIETQRDASKRMTEYVGTGTWGEAIIKELYGVSVTSDVS